MNFDLNSVLGFTGSQVTPPTLSMSVIAWDRYLPEQIPASADLWQGFPKPDVPAHIAANEDQRIEQSLDDTLTTPYNYSFNLSYGREVGKGLTLKPAT